MRPMLQKGLLKSHGPGGRSSAPKLVRHPGGATKSRHGLAAVGESIMRRWRRDDEATSREMGASRPQYASMTPDLVGRSGGARSRLH